MKVAFKAPSLRYQSPFADTLGIDPDGAFEIQGETESPARERIGPLQRQHAEAMAHLGAPLVLQLAQGGVVGSVIVLVGAGDRCTGACVGDAVVVGAVL